MDNTQFINRSEIKDRFLKYVSFETTSYEASSSVPSSSKEYAFAEHIAEELRSIGLRNVKLDDSCYVYACIPASPGCENDPCIGFIAHMDTSSSVSGANIRPRSVVYNGGDIPLGNGTVMSSLDYPVLSEFNGHELIVTDGTTLLGADDKAGIAEIVTAAAVLIDRKDISHGRILLAFTPDEEIGRGVDHFDHTFFDADFAYTVDGGRLGELEYECFNAANGFLAVHGVNIHPGHAKNKMKNAVLMAAEFISMLPSAETPEHTEGYEGFYHVSDIAGNESEVDLRILIRDHDHSRYLERKRYIEDVINYLNNKFGSGSFCLSLSDTYSNMAEYLKPHMDVVERAKKAMISCGVSPIVQPIRGGTDGALLSASGLPCPNLGTGGINPHSVHEFVSVDDMKTVVAILIAIADSVH